MIPTRLCAQCGSTQPQSAAFCAACGHEFRPPRRLDSLPPPVPTWDRRALLQGRPAIRVLIAMIVAIAVTVPFAILEPEDSTYILLYDAVMVGVVLGCVALERGSLIPSLRATGGLWLLLAVPVGYAMAWLGWVWLQAVRAWFDDGQVGIPFDGAPTWILWLSIVILPAVFEELAFRGIFLRTAQIFLRPGWAQFATARRPTAN